MILSRRDFLSSLAIGSVVTAFPSAAAGHNCRRKKGFCGKEEHYREGFGSWYYNWSFDPYASINIPFYPMCWGWNNNITPEKLKSISASFPEFLFGFNEPDGKNQANLSVPEALEGWSQLQGVAKNLVSPSCVSARGRWMQNFMIQAERRKLSVDAIGYHSYTAPALEPFIRSLEKTYEMYGRKIWVTELGVADWKAARRRRRNAFTLQQTLRFMKGAISFMESTDWISGYCWFSGGVFNDFGPLSTSSFFDRAGAISPVAREYMTFS